MTILKTEFKQRMLKEQEGCQATSMTWFTGHPLHLGDLKEDKIHTLIIKSTAFMWRFSNVFKYSKCFTILLSIHPFTQA